MKIRQIIAISCGIISSFTFINAQTVGIPANDDFANKTLIYGTSVARTGDNIRATVEAGEGGGLVSSSSKTVWYSWTAPVTGFVNINTSLSNFDTVLNVYTGDALNNLILIGFNDDVDTLTGTNIFSIRDLTSTVTFFATAGVTYQISLYGYSYNGSSSIGLFAFNLNCQGLTTPTNDNFSGPVIITTAAYKATATNIGATRELGEPNHAGYIGGETLWYRWQVPRSGLVRIKSSSPTIPTVLGVYAGQSVSQLFDATVRGNASGVVTTDASSLLFRVISGQTYYIAVDGLEGRVGDITLELALGQTIALNRDNLNFGTSKVKKNKDLYVTITNSGTATLKLKGATFPAGGFSGNFKGDVGAGKSRRVRVNFAPKKRGTYQGKIVIKSDAASGANEITVRGVGN